MKSRWWGFAIAAYCTAVLLLLMGAVWFGDAGGDDPAPPPTGVATMPTPVGPWRS